MEATATPESGSVDQSSYVADALGGGEQAQTPESKQGNQAETPEKKVAPEGVQKPAEGAGAKPPAKPEPDPFDTVFADEQGGFDTEAFTNYSLPDVQEESPSVELGNEPEKPKDERPEWEKEAEELRAYETNLRKEMLDPLQEVANLIAQGTDPRDALEQVYAKGERRLLEHMAGVKGKREHERIAKLEEGLTARTRQAEAQERAKTNTNEIISALPGKTLEAKSALFHHILFSKEIGAPILNHYFMEQYPGIEKLPPAERSKKADEFLQSIASDKRKLRFIFERAYDRATRLKLPLLLQKARLTGTAQERQQRFAGQKDPHGKAQRQRPKTPDVWDQYSNSHTQYMDRV